MVKEYMIQSFIILVIIIAISISIYCVFKYLANKMGKKADTQFHLIHIDKINNHEKLIANDNVRVMVNTKTGKVTIYQENKFIHTTIDDIYELNKKLLELEQENGNYKDIDENF